MIFHRNFLFLDNIKLFYIIYGMDTIFSLLPQSTLLEPNPVIFVIGNRMVYWYGVIIAIAMAVAVFVAFIYNAKKGLPDGVPLTVAAIVLPCGILMARFFSILFESGLTFSDFFHFTTGGLSIIGGIIGGGVGLGLYILIFRPKRSFAHFDLLVVVLILAQAIGRWGNYCNSEVYGQVVEEGSLLYNFPLSVVVGGVHYEALFFYEFCLDLLGFVLLSVLFFKVDQDGLCSGVYCLYYGTIRSILETRRQNAYILRFQGVPVSLLMSILLILIGLGITIYSIVKLHQKKQRRNIGGEVKNATTYFGGADQERNSGSGKH